MIPKRWLFLCALSCVSPAWAANQLSLGTHVVRVGDREPALIEQLGQPERKVEVADSRGNVTGEYYYYNVEGGSVRFFVRDGRVMEILDLRAKGSK